MSSIEEEWCRIPIDSSLDHRPSKIVPAPVLGASLLPFDELSWEDFERLLWRVLRDVEGLRNAYLYGNRGQKQYGLDIVAFDVDKTGVALQCKKYKKFTASDLRNAVKKLQESRQKFSEVNRFIIAVSSEGNDTAVIDALHDCRNSLEEIYLELWDKKELSYKLINRPKIVIDFFGMPTAEKFCRPFKYQKSEIPNPNAVAVSESLAIGPEKITGADKLIREAEEIYVDEPERALELAEEAQETLRQSGFRPHAAGYENLRFKILTRIGRVGKAARSILEEIWLTLECGKNDAARFILYNLSNEIKEATNDEQVMNMFQVAEKALEILGHPLGALPDPESLLCGDAKDQLRLLVLAGETALANGNLEWINQLHNSCEKLLEQDDDDVDELYRVRLRLLLAEAADNWEGILRDSRRKKLNPSQRSLVTARYARYHALHQNFDEADDLWNEAAGDASLDQRWKDAQTWIFNRRAYGVKRGIIADGTLLPLEIAMGEMGSSDPILPGDSGAYNTALEKLQSQKYRGAAIAAQRALRQAVASADWVGEEKAHHVLGTILMESGEPEKAAYHLVRASNASSIKELISKFSDQYIDVSESLDAPNYWTVGRAYHLLALEADLIPDDSVEKIVQKILTDFESEKIGTLVDVLFADSSRYLGAVKVLAGIADRITQEQAEMALSHFESQPEVAPNYFRLHDDEEAVAIAKIATTFPDLRAQAIKHLVFLLGRSQTSRKNTLETIHEFRETARSPLKRLAKTGNQWAQDTLVAFYETEPSKEKVDEAFKSLTKPLEFSESVYSFGTNVRKYSLLVGSLPSEQRSLVVNELLNRAENNQISSIDRKDYLLAASDLVEGLGERKHQEYYDRALHLGTVPVVNEIETSYSHPLGGFIHQSFSIPIGQQAEALYLAACLAVLDEQRADVKKRIYELFGQDEGSSYRLARALQRLGESDFLNDDIGFLAGQDWGARSLAAVLWVKHPNPAYVGYRLAHDPDVRVRKSFAGALADCEETPEHMEVRELLCQDPHYSVRKSLQKKK
ncbi:restriction endonuclease [Rothia aeria]|jgi:hypothetical protein